MNSSILLRRVSLVAVLGTAMALGAAAQNPTGLDAAVGQAIRQAQAGTARATEALATSHYVMRTDKSGRWAFGSAVLAPAADEQAPQGWLFVARRSGASWRVGLEFTSEFAALRNDAPSTVLTDNERSMLAPKPSLGTLAAPNDPYTGLMLPWPVGQSWWWTSGPHQTPRTAIDLAGGDGRVLSSGAGFTYAMCSQPGNPGWVRVYHATGFTSDYYHLANNVNPGGGWLPRGSHLGNISNDVSCGGFSTGPHVHWSIYFGDTALPIHGKTIGGWTFFAGANEREGWATHGFTTANVGAQLFNYGVIEAAATSPRSDFNGDGRADIATFTMGGGGDVFVALSSGFNFVGTAAKWHDQFGFGAEVVLTGDFTGDGRDDVATFLRGSSGDVYVARSTGASFVGTAALWHASFSFNNDIPGVGDVNGDGRDDIIAFNRGSGDAFVALSNGVSFGAAQKWHDFISIGDEYPAVGDVNGDGRDDLLSFTRDASGDVYVALSTGTGFGPAGFWHGDFAFGDELPVIGDFNGDFRDDIATFTRGPAADVYVALSNGSSFVGTAVLWHGDFASSTNLPGSGDFDRDGRDDIVAFTRGAEADVFVARSLGWGFGARALWHSSFAVGDEIPRPSTM